jgi:hypothetical protein
MKKFFFIALTSLVCFSGEIKAQSNSSTTVITFDDDKSSTSPTDKSVKTPKKKRVFPKNNVKVGLFGPAYGQIPFYYERYIADFFTMQAGIGLTTRDFMGDAYSGIQFGVKDKYNESQTAWNGTDESDAGEPFVGFESYRHRKAGVGFCFSISPRFFPGGDAFDGFYLSPSFEMNFRNYKAQKVDVNGDYLKNDYQKEKSSNMQVFLILGWQNNFEPVSLDWSFSSGVSFNKNTRLDVGYTYDATSIVYGNRTVSFKSLTPYFKMSQDIGGIFGKGSKKKKK